MADVRVHDDVAHAVDDAGVHQHEPISLEVDARFGAQLDHRGQFFGLGRHDAIGRSI